MNIEDMADPGLWKRECQRTHGRVLTGKWTHWCEEWDMMPIDETCAEFECCTCFPSQTAKRTQSANKG